MHSNLCFTAAAEKKEFSILLIAGGAAVAAALGGLLLDDGVEDVEKAVQTGNIPGLNLASTPVDDSTKLALKVAVALLALVGVSVGAQAFCPAPLMMKALPRRVESNPVAKQEAPESIQTCAFTAAPSNSLCKCGWRVWESPHVQSLCIQPLKASRVELWHLLPVNNQP